MEWIYSRLPPLARRPLSCHLPRPSSPHLSLSAFLSPFPPSCCSSSSPTEEKVERDGLDSAKSDNVVGESVEVFVRRGRRRKNMSKVEEFERVLMKRKECGRREL